jgi:hypothetical protein
MTTTTDAVSSDEHLSPAGQTALRPAQGRGWRYAGIGAGLAGIAALVGSSLTDAVYQEEIAGDPTAIADKLADQTASIMLLHVGGMVSALLLLVFAAGLRRRLAETVPAGSLLPQVAASGLLLVSVAQLMGTALSTEFVSGADDADLVVPEAAVFFGHWIGTVPWLWVGAGVAALALGVAGRTYGAAARWLTWTSLALGAVTVLFGVSPLQYMAGVTGTIWLTVAAIGLRPRS